MDTGQQLRARLIADAGLWGECADFPRRDWAFEVNNNDTQLGYWDWVITKHDSELDGTEPTETVVTEQDVRTVINTVADDLLEAAGHPETGVTDAINLLVNGTLHRLFTNRAATLAQIVAENYSDDVTISDAVAWITGS